MHVYYRVRYVSIAPLIAPDEAKSEHQQMGTYWEALITIMDFREKNFQVSAISVENMAGQRSNAGSMTPRAV